MRPIALLMLCLAAALATAQKDPGEQLVTCNLRDVPLKQALTNLFDQTQVSFSLEGGVDGEVSARLGLMPFESALQAVLLSSNLTYRCEGGVYQIIRREGSLWEQEEIDRDPFCNVQKTGLPDELMPAVTANKEDIVKLFWRVLNGTGQPFVIGPGVRGSITAYIPAQPIGNTLSLLARRSRSGLSYHNGVWIVTAPLDPLAL